MRFQQLTIGQVFRYKGEEYIKDGPVMALHRTSGKQVLIPRSADLQPLVDAPPTPMTDTPRQLEGEVVIQIVEGLVEHCLQAFEQVAVDLSSEKRHLYIELVRLAREQALSALQAPS